MCVNQYLRNILISCNIRLTIIHWSDIWNADYRGCNIRLDIFLFGFIPVFISVKQFFPMIYGKDMNLERSINNQDILLTYRNMLVFFFVFLLIRKSACKFSYNFGCTKVCAEFFFLC